MTRLPLLAALAAAGIAAAALAAGAQTEHAVPLPAPTLDARPTGIQTAILAGGCFWGMEAVFERVKGVKAVTAGYAGGSAGSASYEQVSSESTGHAEAVKIVYDSSQVSYGTLLKVYFSIAHDPTQRNRQGPDTGTSYRSAIFPRSPDQKAVAKAYIAQLGAAHAFARPIVTTIETGTFFPAEAYHQDFYNRHPDYPYIVMWDKPKVAAFKAAFPKLATRS